MIHALFFGHCFACIIPFQQRHTCFRDSRGKMCTTLSAKNPRAVNRQMCDYFPGVWAVTIAIPDK